MPALSKRQVHERVAASRRWTERSGNDFETEIDFKVNSDDDVVLEININSIDYLLELC